jgi:hypothetical protein
MMRNSFLAAMLSLALTDTALAQDAPVAFEGGEFTITETPEFEKVLAYDGEEIARDYVIFLDRIVNVGGTNVALFDVGEGGNMCGPALVLAWKPTGEGLRHETVGEDECGIPPAAVTDDRLYFVPYLMPGETAPVRSWSPEAGLSLTGEMAYAPEPETGWADVDAASLGHILEVFRNAAVYAAAQELLGDKLTEVATGLNVGGGTEALPSGTFWARGCVAHACGTSDAFMAVDAKGQKLYFAQQGGQPQAWPPLDRWPADVKAALRQAIEF